VVENPGHRVEINSGLDKIAPNTMSECMETRSFYTCSLYRVVKGFDITPSRYLQVVVRKEEFIRCMTLTASLITAFAEMAKHLVGFPNDW